ncbi:hypothetical protein DNTS_001148 [Danionella cerebrum]|uniref:Uncharacterized protein n=1 Tax=Danionella cerebrum TaxID=2873325 RepID=A0A553Q978_9TELE|nr:hypothetical protein DNTS_001148 [Danionella translucida]
MDKYESAWPGELEHNLLSVSARQEAKLGINEFTPELSVFGLDFSLTEDGNGLLLDLNVYRLDFSLTEDGNGLLLDLNVYRYLFSCFLQLNFSGEHLSVFCCHL